MSGMRMRVWLHKKLHLRWKLIFSRCLFFLVLSRAYFSYALECVET